MVKTLEMPAANSRLSLIPYVSTQFCVCNWVQYAEKAEIRKYLSVMMDGK